MASPFTVFRRHQKAMLAVVGILAMIAFVILPSFFDSAGSRPVSNEVVVTTKYGDLRESDLDAMIRNRQIANNFLEALIRQTIIVMREEGRLPFTDFQAVELFRRSLQNQWLLMDPSEASVVENMVLARKAEEMGLVVSDDTINQFIARQTDNKVSADELRGIVESMRISQRQLFSALRNELLAARLREMYEDTLAGSTPAQRWENYLRFKRRATIEAMAVPVADFADKVKAPDDATLIAFFEKYKDQFDRPGSSEPGFHQPRQGKFQYFKADYEALAANVTVTDEEIERFYEENKETSFRLRQQTLPPELMRELNQEAADEGIPTDEEAATEDTPADPAQGESPSGETSADEAAQEKPGEESSGEPTPPDDAPADKTPAADQPDSGPEPGQPETGDDSGSAEPQSDTDADETASDELSNSGDMSQESESEEPSTQSDAPAEPSSESTSESQPSTKAEPSSESDQPSEPNDEPSSSPGDEPSEPSDSDDDSSKADDETPGSPGDDSTPSDDESAAAAPSSNPIPEHTLPDEWTLPRDIRDFPNWEYQPLWMVKNRIREVLERQKAAELSNQVFDERVEAMNTYSEKWLDWLDAVDENPDAKQPAPPNFTRLAEGKSVTAHETGLITAQETLDTDIGRSYVNSTTPFVRAAFEQTRLFVPGRSEDLEGNRYLFWKIEETEDRVPEFAEVRDKVLREWQMVEARPLAVEAAEKLIGRARDASDSLEFVATSDAKPLITAGPFSWLTFGSAEPLSFQQAAPRLSEIEGIEMAGPAFMRRVFTLGEGELGVAVNEPQTVVYAVRLKSFEPSEVVLKETFLTDNYRRYESGGIYERREMYVAWLNHLNDEAGVDWVRAPDQPLRR